VNTNWTQKTGSNWLDPTGRIRLDGVIQADGEIQSEREDPTVQSVHFSDSEHLLRTPFDPSTMISRWRADDGPTLAVNRVANDDS